MLQLDRDLREVPGWEEKYYGVGSQGEDALRIKFGTVLNKALGALQPSAHAEENDAEEEEEDRDDIPLLRKKGQELGAGGTSRRGECSTAGPRLRQVRAQQEPPAFFGVAPSMWIGQRNAKMSCSRSRRC